MNKTEKWIYVLLAVIATFLLIGRFLLLCAVAVGIMFGILLCRDFKLRTSKLLSMLLIIATITVLTLALSIVPQFSALVDRNESIKELLRVAVYIMVLQTMAMIELDVHFHKTVWKTMTVITVVIVILQYTKLIDMNDMLRSFYGDTKQFVYAESDDLSVFRGGSVFINPNVFACFLSAMLANYLFTLHFVKESVVSRIVMFSLLLTGFVLAGSRTGMVLAVLLILYHIYSTSQLGLGVFIRNVALIFTVTAAAIFLLKAVFSIDLLDISALRMFQVEAGLEGSLGAKIKIFKELLANMNGANLLIGYGVYDYANNTDYMVDFDFGYFTTFFGVMGLIAYLLLLYGIYSWGERTLRGRRILNMMLVIITVVFGLTAGIYFHLRMFTVYLLVFMPSLTDMKTQQRLT